MVKSNNLKLALCAVALSGSILSGSVMAGTATVSVKETVVVEETQKSAISGDLGVNFASQYINRGVIRENQGFMAQPYLDLYFNLYEGDGALTKVSFGLGLWSSLNSARTAQGAAEGNPGRSTSSVWYEFDYSGALSLEFFRSLTLTVGYLEANSPNGAFGASRNLTARVDYDDSELLGAFALRPHVSYVRELQGNLGNGKSGGHGNYYEVGIAPALPAFGPVTVTLPQTVGFGTNDFYHRNRTFGYFSSGVNASVALGFIPAAYGSWSVNAGATYYYLHGGLAQANSIQASGHNTFVFNGGLNVSF